MRTPRIKAASWLLAILISLSAGCATQKSTPQVKKFPAGKEFSGFLKDYSNLKPNAELDGKALTYARADAQKSLHRYIAIVVDPIEVYLASNADEAKLPENVRQAVASYYRHALVSAVSSAFPVADQPGPLVLRLRSAVIGVDIGSAVPAEDRPADAGDAIEHAVNIGEVGVEMELIDSETGEQIAAMVDRENLGAGSDIRAANFSKREKGAAARAAFDGWAHRVREFLDSEHTLSTEDAGKASQSYRPYGAGGQ